MRNVSNNGGAVVNNANGMGGPGNQNSSNYLNSFYGEMMPNNLSPSMPNQTNSMTNWN